MNKEEPYRDQAERLKQRIEKINKTIDDKLEDPDQLPPREQLHRQKKKKTKWKIKYPVIRLLVLFFILLPVIIFSVISYMDGKKITGTVKTSNESVGYETINLESPDEEENKEQTENNQENTEMPDEEQNSEVMEGGQTDNSTEVISPLQSSGVNEENASEKDKNSNPPTETAKKQTVSPAKTDGVVYHTVQPKETLYRISMKYYKSQKGMDIIREANHFQGDSINAGQVLKIPLNN